MLLWWWKIEAWVVVVVFVMVLVGFVGKKRVVDWLCRREMEEKIWCEEVYNKFGGPRHVSLCY
jgi:hypothetical protein